MSSPTESLFSGRLNKSVQNEETNFSTHLARQGASKTMEGRDSA
jgi:hypothetical protein